MLQFPMQVSQILYVSSDSICRFQAGNSTFLLLHRHWYKPEMDSIKRWKKLPHWVVKLIPHSMCSHLGCTGHVFHLTEEVNSSNSFSKHLLIQRWSKAPSRMERKSETTEWRISNGCWGTNHGSLLFQMQTFQENQGCRTVWCKVIRYDADDVTLWHHAEKLRRCSDLLKEYQQFSQVWLRDNSQSFLSTKNFSTSSIFEEKCHL